MVHACLCKTYPVNFVCKGWTSKSDFFLHLVSSSDMTNCAGMLDLMHVAEVMPTAATYRALLQSFAEAGDIKVCPVH